MSKEIVSTFTSEDGEVILPVLTDISDVWLNRNQLAELYDRDYDTIMKHVKNALEEECCGVQTAFFAVCNSDKPVEHYPLDIILSVGYRVKSKRGIEFRRWANQVLKERIAEMIRTSNEKVKELMPYKRKVDHQLSLASDWREENSDSKLMIINIRTGKRSTLWKLTADVKKFLESKSLLKRGKIFDDWKMYHNFNEYCRSLIEDEGFEI